MKVIEVSSDTNIGGAGRILLVLLAEMDKTKFDVSVVLPPNSLLKPKITELGVKVIEADVSPDKSLDFAAINEYKRIFKAEKRLHVH